MALKKIRPACFAEVEEFVDCSIYDRYKLEPGHETQGSAIVEEVDSTTVILPGYRALADKFRNLFLKR